MDKYNKQGKYYLIVVNGHLEERWRGWFNGMDIQNLPGEKAVLSGIVIDQSALHGLLIKIRDLGLPLISVRSIDSENGNMDQE